MGTKINYFIIIVVAVIEFLTVKAWFICKSFTDLFHLSSINITLQIEDYVHSEKGKNLGGPYKKREEAEKRLRQVEYFKHKKG